MAEPADGAPVAPAPPPPAEGKPRRSRRSKAAAEGGDEGGSPAGPDPYILMESVADRLKLLNYDTEFCTERKLKPIHRHYFAVPSQDPSEQLHYLASLISWLAAICGQAVDTPDQYDDPNTVCANIVHAVKKFGLAATVSPSAIRGGCGVEVVAILDKLVDTALERRQWRFRQPRYPVEKVEDVPEEVGGAFGGAGAADEEVVNEVIEDDFDDDDDDDDEGQYGGQSRHDTAGDAADLPFGGDGGAARQEIMKADIDAVAWRVEYERVLPQLKVQIRADNKDWRAHIAEMTKLQSGIKGSLTETQVYLDKLHKEITSTLEKIDSREKYVNKQLENIVTDYRMQQDTLAATVERYKQSSGTVTERTQKLAALTDELDTLKDEIDKRASRAMDPKPMLKIKQDLARLKKETSAMDLRIGVLQHTVLQSQLRNKNAMVMDMNQLPMNHLDF
eukprot:CAMPEP_0182920874 /NCGR_PEP_ID=MMETSP0105_2-20130417/3780_1 /TAXON_ID=81532 ORGANISM="Acanthoeca-like sp., Strain 10tr" /NCGR_SAMPLE_ID=MMETSP0105_2 /ASSEMBLY_ACC=CAM_ASM_000205 /LENGTH=447 /DNA_ID=CAMNT_0025058337 /DNA_START=15 /DNA_END=1358 /DNA_ORIENTATION=-